MLAKVKTFVQNCLFWLFSKLIRVSAISHYGTSIVTVNVWTTFTDRRILQCGTNRLGEYFETSDSPFNGWLGRKLAYNWGKGVSSETSIIDTALRDLAFVFVSNINQLTVFLFEKRCELLARAVLANAVASKDKTRVHRRLIAEVSWTRGEYDSTVGRYEGRGVCVGLAVHNTDKVLFTPALILVRYVVSGEVKDSIARVLSIRDDRCVKVMLMNDKTPLNEQSHRVIRPECLINTASYADLMDMLSLPRYSPSSVFLKPLNDRERAMRLLLDCQKSISDERVFDVD